MFDIWYWSGVTENTRRFIERLPFPAVRINNQGPAQRALRPFVLVFPTYGDGAGNGIIPKPVLRFLNETENARRMAGVIGGGNRNFGSLFAQGASMVSIRYDIPVIYKFELAGMPGDAENATKGISQLCRPPV